MSPPCSTSGLKRDINIISQNVFIDRTVKQKVKLLYACVLNTELSRFVGL